MNSTAKSAMLVISSMLLFTACATPPPKVALKKNYEVQGQKLEFGGTYQPKANELIITVNGDPILKGSFPPFTPTTKLNGKYKNFQITGECYFGSVLASKGGLVGVIAGAVQSGHSKTADKCDMFVNSKPADTLFF